MTDDESRFDRDRRGVATRVDETRWGGVVGVGLEYGFAPNWSFGVEYNHMFMDDRTSNFTDVPAAGGSPPTTASARTSISSPSASTTAGVARSSRSTDLRDRFDEYERPASRRPFCLVASAVDCQRAIAHCHIICRRCGHSVTAFAVYCRLYALEQQDSLALEFARRMTMKKILLGSGWFCRDGDVPPRPPIWPPVPTPRRRLRCRRSTTGAASTSASTAAGARAAMLGRVVTVDSRHLRSEGCHDATGGTVGGQIGYRWQAASWVFGLEAQGNWADLNGSQCQSFGGPVLNDTHVDAFGLFTGQIGYAWNNALLYVKGGAAVTRTNTHRSSRRPASSSTTPAKPAGAARLASASNTASPRTGRSRSNTIICSWEPRPHLQHGDRSRRSAFRHRSRPSGRRSLTVRVNYRWGGPVVAKY